MESTMENMRLQKFMALAGCGSRRKCEAWIDDGQVRVNGAIVTELGTKIDPEQDTVQFRGKRIQLEEKKVTVALNKPAGYITTSKDQFGRPNVCELIDLPGVRLYPIGRLDYQTTGLLLLTNDGELAYAMTHPKHHVAKVYHGILKGMVQQEDIEKLRAGVTLEDGYVTRPAQAKYLGAAGSHSRVEITVYEGKNHQVRRMARAIGHPVLKLRRVAVGSVRLGRLEEGEYRVLTQEEIQALKDSALIQETL